ncbi:hypothetical protein [Arthrobacter rhombi]|uniref:hypothetical protein n=1 Tax=Arthrobacter rhombi TaxID=71253 RepID=UPI003FD14C72
MTEGQDVPKPSRSRAKSRAIALLIIFPAGSMLMVPLLYLILSPWLPSRTVVHVGTDGLEYGSLSLLLAVACLLAAVAFIIGGATARGFLKDDHWYQTEKSIAVGIVAGGFGLIGVALASILANLGVTARATSSVSVGWGLLGFVFLFIAAICAYVVFLPRAQTETLASDDLSL